ncbi:MAG: restriction endonuclease subunit S [Ktedonobacteraceae bacterium]
MNNIWPRVALRRVLTPISRPESINPTGLYRILGTHWYAHGLYVKDIKSGSEIQADRIYRVEQGDFVYNRLFAWKGSFAVATEDNHGDYVSNEFPCFRVNQEIADSEYLWKYFSRIPAWEEALSLSTGGTPTSRNRLKEEKLLAMEIPLPPLEEQRRIVVRIEELATRIEEARGLRRETVKEIEKLLPSMVSGTLATFEIEARNVTIESIAHSVTDGDHLPPPRTDSGIPFIFISHVIGGKINFSDCKWVSPEYFNSLAATRIARRGDLLYTAVGSYGIPCLVDTDEPFCFQRHIAIIKPDRKQIIPEFLKWILSSSDVYEQATKAATGSAQLTVPLRAIRKLKFLLPSFPEQRRIVAYLDDLQAKVDALKQLQTETQAELDALLPSILDKAFKGELV